MANRYELNPHETNTALDFFMYYLSMDLRGKLAKQHPEIYNKLTGKTIVVTVRKEDGTEIGE